MKKRLLILMVVAGMIILLGGLLTYGLGINEIVPVPRPDLIVVGTSLIGISLIVSGACDLLGKKTKEMQIEENDERNIALGNAAMASGFKVMNVTISFVDICLVVNHSSVRWNGPKRLEKLTNQTRHLITNCGFLLI